MTRPKVVLADYLPAGGLADLVVAAAPNEFEIVKLDVQSSEAIQGQTLQEADGLFFLFGGNMPETVLRRATRLRFIQTMSAGYEFLDVDLLGKLGIPFATSGDLNSPAVAEHTIALMLAVARKLVQADAAVRAGKWALEIPETHPWTYAELYGKTVGIVGFGNIGRHVARRLQGFDCQLLCAGKRRIPDELVQESGITQVGLAQLFEVSDFVTLHVPLTLGTRHLVTGELLNSMKSSAILINTSRGSVVDQTALIHALQNRVIAGAGLDVLEPEPPVTDDPLLKMDNVVVTPHCAGGTAGTQQRIIAFCWQNIRDALAGRQPRHVVSAIGAS